MKKKRAKNSKILYAKTTCVCGAKIDVTLGNLVGLEVSVTPKINTFIPTNDKYKELWEQLKEAVSEERFNFGNKPYGGRYRLSNNVVLELMEQMERDTNA